MWNHFYIESTLYNVNIPLYYDNPSIYDVQFSVFYVKPSFDKLNTVNLLYGVNEP
jgi:hypothetical protein